jgi:aerobic-type carbon monoxide dehydrogenase small subunit (CoxS/CutS family)
VVVVAADGTTSESRTCIFDAHYFDGKAIVTVEGQATRNAAGEVVQLTPLQQAFIEHFAFQCGYCTPGFLAGATVFIDGLKREPVRRDQLEQAIGEALDVHICRCTGYVRYFEAVRAVALATPGCVVD